MTLACGFCKKFIATAIAIHCNCTAKHVFHGECFTSFAGSDSIADLQLDALGYPCLIYVNRSRSTRTTHASLAPAEDTATSISPVQGSESDTLKDLISTLLHKVINIETKLQDLTSIKTQLSTLEFSIQRCISFLNELSGKTDTFTSTTLELKDGQNKLDKRVSVLEILSSQKAPSGLDPQFETRLEALERVKLSSELILFGVKKTPLKRNIVFSIASALGVGVSSGDIVACFHIPAKGDHPLADCPPATSATDGLTGSELGVFSMNRRYPTR